MIKLYKYIFCRIHDFYVKIFKEQEIPHYFAIIVLSVILVANIGVLIDTIFYLKSPNLIHLYDGYYKYFVLIIMFSLYLFIKSKNRYKTFLDEDSKLSKKTKKKLAVISILYIITLAICFSYQSGLIRDYHIKNPHVINYNK